MSHEAVAAAVGQAVYGGGLPFPTHPLPVRQLDPQWAPILAKFAYAQALSRSIPAAQHERRHRVDMARAELADRTVALATGTESASSSARPTHDDLMKQPARLLSQTLSDLDLLPVAADLTVAWPLSPFELETDPWDDKREMALERLLNVVRQPSGRDRGLSDQEYAETVRREMKTALEEFKLAGTLTPGLVLGGIGLAVLAATGVGLAAAVPAGLAGAAAITATLAAFGPGGMAGGIAMIAGLSGIGSALVAGGAAAIAVDPDDEGRRRLDQQELKTLASADPTQIARTLAAVIAVLRAEAAMDLDRAGRAPRFDQVELFVAALLAEVRAEAFLADRLDIGGASRKEWRKRVEHVERAQALLRELAESGHVTRRALDSGPS